MQSGVERDFSNDLPLSGELSADEPETACSDAEQRFERVKVQLKARLGSEVYSSWFGRMKLAEASKGVVRISVPTAFLRSWINGHYLDVITELWKQEDPDTLKIDIIVRTATRRATRTIEAGAMPATAKTARQTHIALAAGTTAHVRRHSPQRRTLPIQRLRAATPQFQHC